MATPHGCNEVSRWRRLGGGEAASWQSNDVVRLRIKRAHRVAVFKWVGGYPRRAVAMALHSCSKPC